jgi:apolipoprotein N-acyltransferase
MKIILLRALIGVAALSGGIWASLRMQTLAEQKMLWQYEPLWWWLGIWGGILSLCWAFFSKAENRHQRILASTIGGLCLGTGFMPSYSFLTLFVGFVPILWIEHQLYNDSQQKPGLAYNSYWELFKLSFNTFLIWNILATYWVVNTGFVAGLLANTLNALLMTVPILLFHAVKKAHNPRIGNLAFVVMWLGFEWVHLNWELSWSWLNLGNSFGHLPALIQWYEFTGVFGGSLWVLCTNLFIFQAVWAWAYPENYTEKVPVKRVIIKSLLVLVLPILFSLGRYFTYAEPESEKVEILSLQPNHEPHYVKFKIQDFQKVPPLLQLIATQSTPNTKYILFPETCFDNFSIQNLQDEKVIDAFKSLLVKNPNLHLIMGISGLTWYEETDKIPEKVGKYCDASGAQCRYYNVYNSAIQISKKDSAEMPIYHKSKLVPGSECMPFVGKFELFRGLILSLGGTTGEALTTQANREVFSSEYGKIAPIICYESIFGAHVTEFVRKGANVLFVLTNDGWWGETAGYVQHKYMSVLRAIETRRWVVRSANTGTSCFINSKGQTISETAYGVETALRGEVQMLNGWTFYTRYGDLIARISLLLVLLMFASTLSKWFLPNRKDVQNLRKINEVD